MDAISNNRYALLVLVLLGLLLRFWGVGDAASFIGDEGMYVPAAENYIENGRYHPEHWFHPPLKFYMIFGGMKVIGNNPYGWRMANVLCGALSVWVLFLIGKELFPDTKVAFLAAVFIAMEPLHILLSRTAFVDIPAVFFFMASVYITVRYLKGSVTSLATAGIFLGLSMACKWYYLLPAAVLVIYTLIERLQGKRWDWISVIHTIASLIILPVAVYFLTYAPWFQRGYTVTEFLQLQSAAYAELQSIKLETFTNDYLKAIPFTALDWFVKPLFSGGRTGAEGGWGQFFVLMNNAPIWMLTVPACIYMVYRYSKAKDRSLLLIVSLLLSTYLQFVLVKRPIFFYSAPAVLPFVYLSVAYFMIALLNRTSHSAFYYRTVVVVMIAQGLYLYPLISAKYVPVTFYEPLLAIGGIL